MTTNLPARMLRLLSLLQSRREWSGQELAERLGVTGRTVRRDVDRLRELGYPVEGTTGTAGGYRLASGKNLPPLLLDDDEAVAVAVGLRTAADGSLSGIEESSVRALAKLEHVLPARLRGKIAAIAEATVAKLRGTGPQADPTTLAVLATACRDQETVTFEYRDRDGAPSRRRVEPHNVVVAHGRWYLVAHDTDRAGWRSFRLDRIEDPVPARRRFTRRELPDGDAGSYLSRALAAAPFRYTARVEVGAPADTVMRLPYAPLPGNVEAVDEHSCRVRVAADSLEVITQHVLSLVSLGVEFSLDGSPELIDRLQAMARRLGTATGVA